MLIHLANREMGGGGGGPKWWGGRERALRMTDAIK